ncbi:MAG TPA: hypothetical protein VFL13_10525 [Candidatus Baltobacteraceae bacterium]|nr:hypothetical protein [Candidatus Baltobacteraceae bacterium]
METTLVFAYVAFALWVFHLVIGGYALLATPTVASVLVAPQRTIETWVYMFALRTYRYDTETDILNPDFAEGIRCSNIRTRAWLSILYSAFIGAGAIFIILHGGAVRV